MGNAEGPPQRPLRLPWQGSPQDGPQKKGQTVWPAPFAQQNDFPEDVLPS